MNKKNLIANDSNKPLVLSLEPWGEDYTLNLNEEIEFIAEECGEDFYFHIVYANDYIAVYCEGKENEYPRAFIKGVEIDCGYNRNLSEKNL